MFRRMFIFLLLVGGAPPIAAQTVLFDGVAHPDRKGAALFVPTVVTADDYSVLGRLEYGLADRVNLFGLLGGRFTGNDATLLAGGGWAASILRQSDDFALNFGFFNSFVVPIERGGPDALITVAPVFSHSWDRKSRGRITPYAGATATFKINNPGRGATDVNGLLGVKITEIAERWDFIAEVQPGEKSLFAFGFFFRF